LKKVKELEAQNETRIQQSQADTVEEAFVAPQERAKFKEKEDQLEAQVETLQYEKRQLEDQVHQLPSNEGLASLQENIGQLEAQVQALQYEKTMLEDQISQLPSIDAFKSLQVINDELTSESTKLHDKLFQKNILCEEVSTMKEANSGLTEKLGALEFSLETKETELSQNNDKLGALEFSLETKVTELSQINEKLSALEFSLETKETELSQKNSEIEALHLVEASVAFPHEQQQQQQLQAVLSAFDVDTSKGWGGMEEDVLQGEASATLDNAVMELEAEISDLKQKVRTEQEEKAKLNDDLTAAKMKPSRDDYNSMVAANEDLKIKLASIEMELEANKILLNSASNEKTVNEASLNEESKQEWDREKRQLIEKLAAMRKKAKVQIHIYDVALQLFERTRRRKLRSNFRRSGSEFIILLMHL
jgi:chromosome segregation ATPase